MITPQSACYFLLELHNEAAENVTAIISPGVMSDIQRGYMLSRDYEKDINGIVELDDTVDFIQTLSAPTTVLKKEEVFNPLYLPSSKEELLNAFEETGDDDQMRFTSMGGNLFAIKTVNLKNEEGNYLNGSLVFKPFKLPSFEDVTSSPVPLMN